MSAPGDRTRRSLLGSVAALAANVLVPSWSDAQQPSDRGIGGTGAAAAPPNGEDRGIGGTGVIGTIRRFGSIVVNGLRVSFPPDVAVSIDGEPARARDLRIGHVVRVLARRKGGGLSTRAIVALSEVVGPIERAEAGALVVLGQRVALADGIVPGEFRVGGRVAVSGLRRLDGSVVASLVEPRPPGPSRLSGPLEAGPGGALSIGGLRVDAVDPSLAGRRVSLVGDLRDGAFLATSVAVEPRTPFSGADALSIQAYVAPGARGLRTGSGLDLATAPAGGGDPSAATGAEEGGSVLAVIGARALGRGRFGVESVRVDRQDRGGTRGRARRGSVDPAPPGEPHRAPANEGEPGRTGRVGGGPRGAGPGGRGRRGGR